VSPSVPQPIQRVSNRGVRTGPVSANDVSKVLNLAEAAAFVRCSRAHLSNIINGKIRGVPLLPSVRIGRRVLFRRESLELWIQEVESATSGQFSR